MESCTPKDALDAAYSRYSPIDLFVSDVSLGDGSSGTEVAVELAKSHANLPVLFVTGTPVAGWSESDRRNLNLFPADLVHILEKPFLPSDFENAVKRLLRGNPSTSRRLEDEAQREL